MVAVRLVRQNVRRSRFALEPDERQREKFPLLQITLECVCVEGSCECIYSVSYMWSSRVQSRRRTALFLIGLQIWSRRLRRRRRRTRKLLQWRRICWFREKLIFIFSACDCHLYHNRRPSAAATAAALLYSATKAKKIDASWTLNCSVFRKTHATSQCSRFDILLAIAKLIHFWKIHKARMLIVL